MDFNATLTLKPAVVVHVQAKMIQSKKARGGQEIPVPKVRRVETYTRDYLPIFQEHNTYLRGRGTSRLFMLLPCCLADAFCMDHASSMLP